MKNLTNDSVERQADISLQNMERRLTALTPPSMPPDMEARLRERLSGAASAPHSPASPVLLFLLLKWALLILSAIVVVSGGYFAYVQLTDYLHRC